MEETVRHLVESIHAELRQFETKYTSTSLRNKVLHLADILKKERKLNIAVVRSNGCDGASARERIRQYLTAYPGVAIGSIELEVVSGISEYARRVRELRVQLGYKILTGNNNDPATGIELRRNEYILLDRTPDRDAAHRWHLANDIRKQSGAAQDRLLAYLKANVERIVTTEELAYVAKISEWPRRVRELRTEQGYSIATLFTGRPDLRQGEYVLESLDRIAEEHDRHIPSEVQKEVFERDNNTCRICGGTFGHWTRAGSSMLELHHLVGHASRGENIVINLVVLCNACHDDVHSGRANPPQIEV